MYILLNAAFATNSIIAQVVDLKNNPISIENEINNCGFILFFVCFFIIAIIMNNRNGFLFSAFSRLFSKNDRQNMFYENITNETLNKMILSLQTTLLLSIIIYCYAIHQHFISTTTPAQMLIQLGKNSLLLIVFFLYKFISYSFAGSIFFKKDSVRQWNDDFFSIISLNGIFIFLPALILFYVEPAFNFLFFLFIIYLIFNLFLIVYKIKTLFFRDNRYLLYFILYLCTQEIIPLYLVYRGFVYLIVQKDTTWMQA